MQTNQCHILIVDDEEDIKEICCDVFEAEGFKVSSAACGEAALEIFYKQDIDVVISDAMMPGMTGEELLAEMRKSKKPLPYFFLSTGLIEKEVDECLSNGAVGVISKPFDVQEIVALVREKLTEAA